MHHSVIKRSIRLRNAQVRNEPHAPVPVAIAYAAAISAPLWIAAAWILTALHG